MLQANIRAIENTSWPSQFQSLTQFQSLKICLFEY